MMRKITLASTLASLFVVSLANSASVNQLVNARTRPTMSEISESQQDLLALPASFGVTAQDNYLGNKGDASLHYQYEYWLQQLNDGGPHFIASIEKAFPGATWAFIGRDSMAIADLTEAFYLGIGQTKRVVRVGLSKQALAGTTEEQMVKYLSQLGLDLTNSDGRPFILIDTVSSGYGRQGKVLMNAVYNHVKRSGGDVSKMVSRFNMIGIIVSTFNAVPNPIESEHRFNKAIFSRSEQIRQGVTDFTNEPIFTYKSPVALFSESGYEHYTGVWHGPYGPLSIDHSGTIIPNPGPLLDTKFRMAQLNFQNRIFNMVTTDDFSERVGKAASELGYDFSAQQARLAQTYKGIDPEDAYRQSLAIRLKKRDIRYDTTNLAMKNRVDAEFAKFNDKTKKSFFKMWAKSNEDRLGTFLSKLADEKEKDRSATFAQYLYRLLEKASEGSYEAFMDKADFYAHISLVSRNTKMTEKNMQLMIALSEKDPDFKEQLYRGQTLSEKDLAIIKLLSKPAVNTKCIRFYN